MATTEPLQVRRFERDDVPELLELMRALARFEQYIDAFRVTADDLIERGLGEQPRFDAYVAQRAGGPLLGMAVTYVIPWTYDLRPTLVLKELYVTEEARSLGVGRALMQRVAARAEELGCPRIHWLVLKTNARGAAFYRCLGARPDEVWDNWALDERAIAELAKLRATGGDPK